MLHSYPSTNRDSLKESIFIMDFAKAYAERNLGPHFEGALIIADAIRDGAQLPVLDDIDAVKGLIEEQITVANNREAERFANKIIMEWKEARGEIVVNSPFGAEHGAGASTPLLSALRTAFGAGGTAVPTTATTDGDGTGLFSNDMLKGLAETNTLKKQREAATNNAERERIDTEIEKRSDAMTTQLTSNITDQMTQTESFYLCAKIVALGPDSPLQQYYATIMDAVQK